ncbi:unnamed protein product [Tetraodon nigroviridis]|uniref:(spotted green pufferfish) hypothetical protein n=1 Tax=Tetraodon nigroviridis TaxID=99883 RepID=Q4RZ59_TETNG|nr:unnamed protein product [Tetraodon nigroviridis]
MPEQLTPSLGHNCLIDLGCRAFSPPPLSSCPIHPGSCPKWQVP